MEIAVSQGADVNRAFQNGEQGIEHQALSVTFHGATKARPVGEVQSTYLRASY